MQIVIDIPKRTYEQLKFLREQGFDGFETIIDKAVANGTPLPKGHGRLIDADELKPRYISPEAWYSPMWGFELVDIENAPTIIEADKEEEECRHF